MKQRSSTIAENRTTLRYAAFTPSQQVARCADEQLVTGNKQHVARIKLLVARNKLRVARNLLLQATCCAQRTTCCAQLVALVETRH